MIADFGALVKGAGFYQSPVVTQNGGRFQAGNSPGAASFGAFTFGPGGVDRYVFSINDADGGQARPVRTAVSGWGLVKAERRQVGGDDDDRRLRLDRGRGPQADGCRVAPGDDSSGSDAGRADGRLRPDAAVRLAGRALGRHLHRARPTRRRWPRRRRSTRPASRNPIGGMFGWSLDAAGQTLSLTYTPVPEPGTFALAAIAVGAASWLRRRHN